MSKDFFILHSSKIVYAPGHYEREDAEKIAHDAALRFPGRTYTVVRKLTTFQFPRSKKGKL